MVGIDDWAFRCNHRHGTIFCDLERRRVVALLPDCEQATAEVWLRQHPGITILSLTRWRLRRGSRSRAARRHSGRRSLAPDGERQRSVCGSRALVDTRFPQRPGRPTINPTLLTAAERLQYEGFLRNPVDREDGFV